MSEQLPAAQIPFNQLERMAHALAKSGLFAVKTPEAALSLLLIAQAENIPVVQAMMDYQVIQGTPSLKSAAMLARFQRSGGRVEWLQSTDECVEGKFAHPVGGNLTVKWDTARCTTAGLAGKEMHKKFPLQMKRARCISEACRALAPNAIPLGLYTVEETKDMDAIIDVTPPVEQAVIAAVADLSNAMPDEEFESILMTLDVKSKAELVTAFNTGWKLATQMSEMQKKRFRAWRDDMLTAIEGSGGV